ncbi:Hint domain-containing protein [Roseicyclus persicicus]|uniref:Hint domain-containing protein n=1 Tax=Roseicyclus persicicus TaxID=2650661 RepID=A0A7X6JW06_9RHOB|nr:Hint domain-containing protein [Roseibacterium persicicum]NKX43902.1 Hint domain-containing protein [Roseibacterium persicicum]
MAAFDYGSVFIYDAAAAGPNTLGPQADDDGTIDDGEADGVFDLGPPADFFTYSTVVNTPFGPVTVDFTGLYQGYIVDFDGETVPVFLVPPAGLPFGFETTYPEGVYLIPSARDEGAVTPPAELNPADITAGDFDAVCFLPGTAIATPLGATAVEDLRVGDTVLTADGRAVPVTWVGIQTVSTVFGRAAGRQPVRIAEGALGGGLPRRDLCLTADHALLIDGLLVAAGALVKGRGITWIPEAETGARYTVYHVETAAHDVILAEGTPAETFVDYIGRRAFDNHAEYLALYGADRPIPESRLPRITAARHLPAGLRARLGIAAAA